MVIPFRSILNVGQGYTSIRDERVPPLLLVYVHYAR